MNAWAKRRTVGVWLIAFLVGITLPLGACAEGIDLETILQQAVQHSYDLKIADTDTRLSRTDIMAARADYFPTIRGRVNAEYLKDLQEDLRPLTSVGDTVIPAGTRYQNSIGVNMQYLLHDFGVRKRKLQMAKKDVLAKAAAYDQVLRDLKLKLVDLYAEALTSYRALLVSREMLALAQQAYQMKMRLYEAGTISRVDVANEAIQVAQSLDEIEALKKQLSEKLHRISYYTQEDYPEDIALADIQEDIQDARLAFSEEETPEASLYALEIEKKQKEIELLRRQYLPQVSIYSNYVFYGFDPEAYSKSFSDIKHRTASFGVSIQMPLFDGLKNLAAIRRAELEKEKLILEKKRTLAELKHEAESLSEQINTQTVLLQTKATIVDRTEDKLNMENRLLDQQLIDKTQGIQARIDQLEGRLEQEKTLIEQVAALKKLSILSGGS